MKHRPETVTVTVNDIVNRADRDTDTPWFDLLGIYMPLHRAAIEAQDYDSAADSESAWMREHSEDKVEVSWPDHVTIPRYNDDANYRFVS